MPKRDADLKLNPSDFTNLKWCRLCLWLKLRNLRPKRGPGSHWNRKAGWNDRVTAECERLDGRSTQSVDPSLPAGRWTREKRHVFSEQFVIGHPSRQVTTYIRGYPWFNVLVAEFDDGTFGLYKVKLATAEFKNPNDHLAELHAYTRAFETDDRRDVQRRPITHLGLIYVTDNLKVTEVRRDEARFTSELIEVGGVWLLDQPPPAAPGCRGPHLLG